MDPTTKVEELVQKYCNIAKSSVYFIEWPNYRQVFKFVDDLVENILNHNSETYIYIPQSDEREAQFVYNEFKNFVSQNNISRLCIPENIEHNYPYVDPQAKRCKVWYILIQEDLKEWDIFELLSRYNQLALQYHKICVCISVRSRIFRESRETTKARCIARKILTPDKWTIENHQLWPFEFQIIVRDLLSYKRFRPKTWIAKMSKYTLMCIVEKLSHLYHRDFGYEIVNDFVGHYLEPDRAERLRQLYRNAPENAIRNGDIFF